MKKLIATLVCTGVLSAFGILIKSMASGDSQPFISINAGNQTTIYTVQGQSEPKVQPTKSTTKNSEKP
jgi:hypothetical protein